MARNTEVSIRGGYQPFQLNRDYHLDTFGNTLDKIAQQHEKALEQRSSIQAALANVKLNAAEDEWKQNYINDIQNQIDNAAQFGNYSTALSTATKLAGDAVSNPALLGRIRANEQYEKEIAIQEARLAKGEIGQTTFNWWKHNNPYSYEDAYDKNGNIIGGTEFKPTRPVADINWGSMAMAAFKMITPYKNTTDRDGSTTVHNNTSQNLTRGKNNYKPGEAISTSSHSSNSIEKVSKEDITARIEELLASTSDGYAQAEQAYKVAKYDFKNLVTKYNELVEENPNSDEAKDLRQMIDQRKQLMYRNGSKIDYKEYYARMVTDNLFADGLAYEWRTTNSGGSSTYSLSEVNSRGSGSGVRQSSEYFPGAKFNYYTGYWEGANVEMSDDTSQYQERVGTSSTSIAKRFK